MAEADKPVTKVVVTDVQMRFGSMVEFMVKAVLAAIPAVIILTVIGFGAFMLLYGATVGTK